MLQMCKLVKDVISSAAGKSACIMYHKVFLVAAWLHARDHGHCKLCQSLLEPHST